jgi:signal transduction histidine kinase
MLTSGAERIGRGDLAQRISIRTGDELEALGNQFNIMAARLEASHASLEHKVKERTAELEDANQAKSRLLAVASHDLRQPLLALALFVAQLRKRLAAPERNRVVGRIETVVAGMNEMFDALLDASKLDSKVVAPDVTDVPLSEVFARLETTFMNAAREKGLSLRIVPSSTIVRSDAILLERILLNLVSNALRYTERGGVVVGCRRQGRAVRIEVWDSGVGIPVEQRDRIFGEFVRLPSADAAADRGLGLGLAIVARLCTLLGHQVGVSSVLNKGSRFFVTVPRAPADMPDAARTDTRANASVAPI